MGELFTLVGSAFVTVSLYFPGGAHMYHYLMHGFLGHVNDERAESLVLGSVRTYCVLSAKFGCHFARVEKCYFYCKITLGNVGP